MPELCRLCYNLCYTQGGWIVDSFFLGLYDLFIQSKHPVPGSEVETLQTDYLYFRAPSLLAVLAASMATLLRR